ncbi:MAG: hypothetical protein LBU70_00660 [Chitinispirillales bacterium]|nr:hypothetical protein [Chitinispirillales bacterium]
MKTQTKHIRRIFATIFFVALTATNTANAANSEKRVYELYISSQCSRGMEALKDLAEVIRAFPLRKWDVRFIGKASGDTLTAAGGEAEILDNTLWLGVKELYPFRYHEFLFLRAHSPLPTEKLLVEMDLDLPRIKYWADDIGPSELRKHYLKSMELDVSTSPTLFVNGRLRDRPLGGLRLLRDKCRAVDPEPPACGEYPECYEDYHCQAPKKLGRCIQGEGVELAFCEFRDDVSFALTVLVATSTQGPENNLIATMEEMLPGAQVSVVYHFTDEGKNLLEKYMPQALPFFHFEQNVENAYRFLLLSDMIEPVEAGGFTLKKRIVRENYFPQRKEKSGLIELYADPLMPDIGKVINILLKTPGIAGRVALRPALPHLYHDDDRETADSLREEEALKWLVLSSDFPKRYPAYLKKYARYPGSSDWLNWFGFRKIRVNRKNLVRRIEAGRPAFSDYIEDFSRVTAGESMMILVDNRWKIEVRDEEVELVRILELLLKKTSTF